MVYPRALFDWTKVIQNPELKVAVDFALCSVCRHYPDILTSLLATFVDLLENSTRASSTSTGTVLECQSVMETLARAAQSEPALEKLVHSGLLDLVSEAITGNNPFDSVFRYCFHLIICGFLFFCIVEYCLAVSNWDGGPVGGGALNRTERRAVVALEFWTLLCEEWGSGASRDVLAAYLGGKPLLQLLLRTLCGETALDDSKRQDQQGGSRIQDVAIAFFRQFCWAHRDNSRRFAEILLTVLQPVGKS